MSVILYGWGANSYGQLGTGEPCEQIEVPQEVPFQAGNILLMAGGGGHSFILDTHGRLWSCGWNSRGQLGLGHREPVHQFQLVPVPGEKKVKHVSCGWDFTLIITECGRAWGCGSNAFGQLGLGEECRGIDGFVPIPDLTDVVDVACGLRHTLFVNMNGKTFGCGSSKKGQLGGDQRQNFFIPNPIPNSVKIKHVYAGQHVSMFLDQEGNLTALGDFKPLDITHTNADGSLSVQIKSLSSPISNVSCGWTHTLVTSEDGQVFCFGRNNYFQLANEDPNVSFHQPSIESHMAKSGSEHCLALSKSGNELLAWGWNEHGSCGNGNGNTNVSLPARVSFPCVTARVLSFQPASGHNFAVVKQRTDR